MSYPNILALNLTKNPEKARYSVRFGEITNLVRKSTPFPYQIRIILTRPRTLPPDTSDSVAECVTTFGLKEEGCI